MFLKNKGKLSLKISQSISCKGGENSKLDKKIANYPIDIKLSPFVCHAQGTHLEFGYYVKWTFLAIIFSEHRI